MAKSLIFSTFPANTPLDKNKTPIILLHGWGLNSGVWHPLLKLFDHNSPFQLITIDLPGFGENATNSVAPYKLETICQEISAIIEQPAIYLGWSLGGLVASQMALQFPQKVLGLITVASSPYFVEENKSDWSGIKLTVLNSFHQQLAQDASKTINGFLKIQAMGSPHIRQDLKLITQLVMAHDLPSQKILDDSLALLSHCDLRADLAKIKQPFLRLYGQNDSLVPKAAIEKINCLAPQSDFHTFAHASHAPFISHADDFYKKLALWLNEHFILTRL